MLPNAQEVYQLLQQQMMASIAPSMAQNADDFSTLSMFSINPLQASPDLIGVNARQSQVGGGEKQLDVSNMRKRGRKSKAGAEEDGRKRGREEAAAAAAAAAEGEEMAPSASVHSNVPVDNYQPILPASNSIQTGAGTSPSYSLLYFPDDPDSDLSFTTQRDLLELDLFLSAQMERLRAEVEQRRRRHWAGVARAVEDAVQRAVRARDEEIASVARRNSVLEERAGALAMEGQMWRALARTNEAAAAALRRDIELARQQAADGPRGELRVDGEVGDSVSCCEGLRREQEGEEEEDEWDGGEGGRRLCRVCRRLEVSTLVLPCRHLCLCGECDAATAACPLCGAQKSASIRVHLL